MDSDVTYTAVFGNTRALGDDACQQRLRRRFLMVEYSILAARTKDKLNHTIP